MKIVKMNPIQQNGNGKLLAFFDVQTNDGVIIKGFRLFKGPKGNFISPPSEKGKDGKYYDTVILPQEVKDSLQKNALEKYGN